MSVIGTLGHVDHGKSTLLRALTGMEPDRLPEEKKRGMTIDLNFVWIDLPKVGTVGIVDVPGHQKFIGNMLAGFSGFDGFLFVIAADDGWMPQSQEHLNLLKGFSRDKGIVVVTKIDLVDSRRVEEVKAEVVAKFKAAGVKTPPVVLFSPKETELLTQVREELGKLVEALPHSQGKSPSRLWVDRVFTPKGQGVVVTGTLRGGSLSVGQDVFLFPAGSQATIRGLQSHGKAIEMASPDSRVAIQFGKEANHLKRGELISADGKERLSQVVDVILFPEPGFSPKRTVQVGFHFQTLVASAQLTVLNSNPSGTGARLRLASPVALKVWDRFVLRTSGEEKTIGAGVVLDVTAEKLKLSRARTFLSPSAGELSGLIRYLLSAHRILSESDLPEFLVGNSLLLSQAHRENGYYFERVFWNEALRLVETEISEKNLLEALGISRSQLSILLNTFEAKNRISREKGKVKLRQADRSAGEEESLIQKWLSDLLPTPLIGPNKSLVDRAQLQKWIEQKKVIRLAEDHFLSARAYRIHCQKVETVIRQKGSATTSELKDVLGFSRKYAVMILERMDSDRITYLKEGSRKLLRPTE